MTGVDAVVCGAGIAGLTTGLALAQQGWRVVVLEKLPSIPEIHKGELLQPRSVGILERLGALPAVHAAGAIRANRLVCRRPDGRIDVALDYAVLPPPYDHILVHYYPRIQAAIEAALPSTVEVRRGVRVTGLLRDHDGRVIGVRTIAGGYASQERAGLVIACDGRGSSLRTAAGLNITQSQYPHRLLSFDLVAPGNGVPDTTDGDVSAYLTGRGLRLVYAMPGGRIRLYVQIAPHEYRRVGRAGLPRWAAQVVAGTPGLTGLRDVFTAGLPSMQALSAWRYVAPRWWRPGFALLGDAAHGVHPMAAQGMNAAIADAWALAQAVSGLKPDEHRWIDAALARYESAGIRRVSYTARVSHSIARLFTDTSWTIGVPARFLVRRGTGNPRLQQILTYNISGLGVRRFTRRDRLYLAGILRDPDAGLLTDLQPTW